MARVKGVLENIEGHLDVLTFYRRDGATFVRPRHIYQPRRLSRGQLLIRERQSHNNALWRALKRTGHLFFEGGRAPYYRFMSVNMFSPVPYLEKGHIGSGCSLLLPEMRMKAGRKSAEAREDIFPKLSQAIHFSQSLRSELS